MRLNINGITRVLPVLVLGLAYGNARSAGFQLLEQNASGMGNAYAGSAVVAENASTLFFNPAGMTQLKEREASAGLSLVRPSFKFTNQGSSAGVLATAGSGGDAGDWAFLPNGYLSWALNKDLYVGVGLGAPFGLVTEYNNPWVGGAQALKFDVKTYNINPSVAYKLADGVSVGTGLNWQRMKVEYTRLATVTSTALAATQATLSADSDSWGWNVGLLWTLSPETKLGVSYRSKIKHDLKGDLAVTGPAAGASPALTTGNAQASVKVPDLLVVSVLHELSRDWQLLGDVSWTGWSSIPKVDIVRTSGALSGATVQSLDTAFRDTWRVALGANYRYSDMIKLKFGVAYDQTPVRDAQHRLVSLPDNDRTWLSTGVQLKLDKESMLDFGVTYLRVPSTSIDNDQSALGRGRVTGTYDASVWILGAQYSLSF